MQEAARAAPWPSGYYHEFVDLREVTHRSRPVHLHSVDLMFRYNFVPIEGHNGTLDIALADPRNLSLIDELAVLLGKSCGSKSRRFRRFPTFSRRPSNRSACWMKSLRASRLDVVGDEENPDETLSIDRLAGRRFRYCPGHQTGGYYHLQRLERRASDIHIETRDQEVAIKYPH